MYSFLSVITAVPNWTNIIVEEHMYGNSNGKRWIDTIWESESSNLEKEYRAKSLKISYGQDEPNNVVYLNISRM